MSWGPGALHAEAVLVGWLGQSQDSPQRQHPGRTAEVEVEASQDVLWCSMQGVPWRGGWIQGEAWMGDLEVLHTRGVLEVATQGF